MSLHAQKWLDNSGFGRSFHNCIKILYFLVTRLSEVQFRAFSEFNTLNAKMPGKCPVSDCCLELCMCYNILIVLVVVFLLIMSSLIPMN